MLIKFTSAALKTLTAAGANNDVLKEIAETAEKHPRSAKNYEVEAFDGLQWGNIKLSWIRDYKKREIIIMTLKETEQLDRAQLIN